MADTEFQGGVALSRVVEQTSRKLPEQNPCAFIGALRSAVSIPMSIVTGLLGYPQISASSTSADLDDKSQYPLFGRTVPSDEGTAIPIILYMRDVLKLSHLAVINVNDAYGNAFVDGLRHAAEEYAPDMIIHQIPLDEAGGDSILTAVNTLKTIKYRFIFCIVFTQEVHDNLLIEAYNNDLAGNGKHNWFFADSFLGTLDGRTFEKGSPLQLAYSGVGLLEASGGVEGMPQYDKYSSLMSDVKNPVDLNYLGSLIPTHDHPDYPEELPFIYEENFLTPITNGFNPFAYEAAIGLGLAACAASQTNRSFSGRDHFDYFVNTTFQGVSGDVVLAPITGSRTATSCLFKVANWLEEDLGGNLVEFKPVVTDLFQDSIWNNQRKYIFNDGTSDLPTDIAPDGDNGLKLGVAIGVPVVVVFITGIVLFLFYENKRKQNDSVWKVEESELKFDEPPEVIGRGTFGLVLVAEYRGTKVAVKRVIPPSREGDKAGSIYPSAATPRISSKVTKRSTASSGGSESVGDDEETGAVSKEGSSMSTSNSALNNLIGKISWGGADLSGDRIIIPEAAAKPTKVGTVTSSWGGASLGSGVGAFATAQQGFASTMRGAKRRSIMREKLKREFVEEMRRLSKLRHPCITTIMGKCDSAV